MTDLPKWYDEQNFSDAGLTRNVLDVGEFEVEFEYDPGDRSVGIPEGFEGVCLTIRTGLIDTDLFFAYEAPPEPGLSMNLPGWALTYTAIRTADRTLDLIPPDPTLFLKDFPNLLKVVEDKWAAIEKAEREEDEKLNAMLEESERDRERWEEEGR